MSLMYFKEPPLLLIHFRINITRTHAKGHPTDNSWNIDAFSKIGLSCLCCDLVIAPKHMFYHGMWANNDSFIMNICIFKVT